MHSESTELKILEKLKKLPKDPKNHCVPVLDVFEDNENHNVSYIVMPFLRAVDDPPFETVGQVIDFVTQMVEVCKFLLLDIFMDPYGCLRVSISCIFTI